MCSAYSPELASALDTYRIPTSKADEMALAAEFDRLDKSRRWREGLLKSSFNYLLLDPRWETLGGRRGAVGATGLQGDPHGLGVCSSAG